jgi:hypothetical protein
MGRVSAFQRFPCRGEAGLLGNTLQIRVHLCSSVVEPKNGSCNDETTGAKAEILKS